MQDLTISVGEILGRPGEYRKFHIRHPLEGVHNPVATLDDSPIEADLRAESVVEGVLVTGKVAGSTTLRCARCLREFSSPLSLELCELYLAPGREAAGEEDAYELTGHEMHLEPMLRDATTLALPLRPLCREDCRGLCARCGTDLNDGACDCTEDDIDPRWAELSALRDRLGG